VTGAPLQIVVLISGRGSNLLAIVTAAARGTLRVRVTAVISDRPAAPGLLAAAQAGLVACTLDPGQFPDRSSYDAALADLVAQHAPDLVVLAGFMRILSASFVARFRGRLINIHPSLLPRYRGLHTHRRALAAGDAEHGASVHYVTEELDGGPVVAQARVAVLPGDTEQTLSARVQAAEHRLYPMVIGWIATGRLTFRDERAWLDGQLLSAPVQLEYAHELH
jgi:phosphoribosylglycinamide formyltransferase 1